MRSAKAIAQEVVEREVCKGIQATDSYVICAHTAQIETLEWAAQEVLQLGSKLNNPVYHSLLAKIAELKGKP